MAQGLVAQRNQGAIANPALQKIVAQIEAKVKPEQRDAFDRIITAGMKVMFSKETSNLIKQALEQPGSLGERAGKGVANLLLLLFQESNKSMPLDVGMLSAVVLLAHALDFAEKIGGGAVDAGTIDEAAQTLASAILDKLGVSPQQVAQMAAKAQPQGA